MTKETVSDAMVEAARNAFKRRGWGYRDEDIRAALTAALAAEPGEAVAVGYVDPAAIARKSSVGEPLRFWCSPVKTTCFSMPLYASPQPANPAQVTDAQIEHMVQRFLGWKLPEHFRPDGGISYEPIANKGTKFEFERTPYGTNLFDHTQATAMVRYMFDGMPAALAHPLPLKEEVERVLAKLTATNTSPVARDYDAARSLLSRIRAGAQEGLKPIETAPKDGSPFLAFGSYVYEGDTAPTIYMGVAEYSGEPNWPWRDAEGLHRETFYSHWMPLPASPSTEVKGGPRP